MKKLQNNFTTPEQSKRLLELGVPADSADLKHDISEIELGCVDFPTFVYGDFRRYPKEEYIPCWSVGRLIELYMKARGLDFMYFRIMSDSDMIDSIVRMFVENQNEMDFSKLEE